MPKMTQREEELLRLVQTWCNENDANTPVDREWIMERMFLSSSRISELKDGLRKKGFIEADRNNFLLTDQAREFLTNTVSRNIKLVAPIHIPILGQVKAGTAKRDDLQVYISGEFDENAPTVPIPHLHNSTSVFILEVVGRSMEKEGIFEGDFVLIQPYEDGKFPKQRELIVTLYLPPANEGNMEEEALEGPTLKYFTDLPNQERPYRLSWKREIDRSDYTIETKMIKPIGKVVGVYRRFIE